MNGDKITPREAQAFVLIHDNGKLSPDAQQYLNEQLREDAAIKALLDGSYKQLRTYDELSDFRSALSPGVVGKIDFWSPGTGIHYTPAHYYTILHLVTQEQIKVFEVTDKGLGAAFTLGFTGLYYEGPNQFIVLQGATEKFDLIVHESTHAIQDWLNRSAIQKLLEADAYIAEALAHYARARNWGPPKIAPTAVAFELVVPQIISGAKWKDAYAEVVKSVERTVSNDEQSQKAMNEKLDLMKGEQGDELKRMLEILNTIREGERSAARMTPPGSGPGGELTEKDKATLREFMKR
jgi:hypothetical protein